MKGRTRYSTDVGEATFSRRRAVFGLLLLVAAPADARAQMSQRARQIRERRACEQDLPTCRPEIRAQLIAERQRLRWGLSGLAVAVAVMAGLLWRRHRIEKQKEAQQLSRLHGHVAEVSGKSDRNQAQSSGHDPEKA